MKYNIICENAIEDNDTIYFVSFHGRALYAYDKNTHITKCLGAIPNQPLNGMRLYEAIIKMDSKLILAPSSATSVLVLFDLNNEEFSTIDLGIGDKEVFKFNSIIPFDDSVYLIGQGLHVILRVNLKNRNVDSIFEFNESGKWMCSNGTVIGKFAYIPLAEYPAFIELNLETSEAKVIKYNASIKSCCGIIEGINNDLWLVGLNEPYLINLDFNGTVLKEVEIECLRCEETPYGFFENPVREDDMIYLFPLGARNVYCYNIGTEQCKVCESFNSITESAFSNPNNCRLFSFQAREHFMYLVECNNKKWHEINLKDITYNSFDVLQDPEIVSGRWKYGIIENQNERLTDLFDVLR